MKKMTFLVPALFFVISTGVSIANNSESKSVKKSTEVVATEDNKLSKEEEARIVKRVEEIREMDKSKLSSKEKKDLRKELNVMKKEVRKTGYIIYISGTTIIIILLIILLV